MAEVPIELPTGRVVGKFIFEVQDNNDPGEDPQLVPVTGDIGIKSAIDNLSIFDPSLGKFITFRGPHKAIINSEGELATPDPNTGDPMYTGMSLWSNDSDKLSVKGWTYTATFNLKTADGKTLNLPPATFTLATGQEVDLADVIRVPATPGYGLPQAEGAALRAEAAAVEASASADVAVQGASTTDGLIAGFVSDPSTQTSNALSAAIVEESEPLIMAEGLTRSRKGDPARVRFARPRAKLLTTFPAGLDWYVGGVYSTATLNHPGENAFGTQGCRVVTAGTAGSPTAYISTPTPGGLSEPVPVDTHHVRVWVKFNGPNKLYRIRLLLSDVDNFTTYYSIECLVSNSTATVDSFPWKYDEWVPVLFNMSDATVEGGSAPVRANLNHLRVALNDRNTAAIVDIGKIEYVPKGAVNPTAVVSFTYDDSHVGQYTYARKHLAAHGFRGELFPICDWIDSGANYLTSAQVRELHDLYQWDVSPHASAYAAHSQRLPFMTDAEIHAEMNSVLEWHEARGYETLVYAYPSGIFTAANAAIVGQYFPAARMAAKFQTETQPPYLPHRIQVRNGASTSVANIKSEIDKAVAEGTAYHLMFHDVIAGVTSGNHINEADHKEIVDYVAASGATVRTLTDLVKDYAG